MQDSAVFGCPCFWVIWDAIPLHRADLTPPFAAHFLGGALGGPDSSLFQTEVIPE